MEQQQLFDLLEKSKAGDRQAQEKLVTEAQNRVYYHCKKMLKNDEDALDATQDVLITMLTSLDKLRQPAAFWGWVNGITANRCKHLLTQGTKEWQIPEDEEGNSLLDSVEDLDEQVVPDKAIDNAETQRLVMEIIDALPPEQKMTVLFYYYDEMPIKEIAAAMEVSEGTVKSRLNYARKSIKEGVEKLEKKGTKLYGISPLPFLAYFLRKSMAMEGLSPAAAGSITQGALTSAGAAGTAAGTAAGATAVAGTAGSTGTAAAAAGAAAKGIVGSKLALGLAGLAVAGTVAGGVALSSRQAEPGPTPTPVSTAAVAVVAPTPEPEATPESLEGLPYDSPENTMTAPEILALPGESLEPAASPDSTPEATPEVSPAAEDFLIENGVLVKYNGPGGDVVIPDGVTAIGKGAFISSQSRKALTGVTLPVGVTGIGDNAFQGCSHLKRISLPTGLTSIGNGVFWACLELNDIALPAGLISIGDDAFRQCEALRSITIPNQATTIGEGAFAGSGLESIEIPDSVTVLGGGVFSHCENLSQVSLGTGLTQIESTTFYACPSLTEITIPANISHMGSNVFFDGTYNLTTVTILNPAVSFESTFYKASTMNPALTLYAPAGSTTETYATQNRIPFVALDAPEPTPTPAADPDFTIENGTLVKYNGPGGDVIIPDGVVTIGYQAFANNTAVTGVTLPNSVKTIAGRAWEYAGAFKGCSNLARVTFSSNTPELGIGDCAFWGCGSLVDIELPSSVSAIGESAFYGCGKLRRITLPDAVGNIGRYAFSDCTALTDVILSSGMKGEISAYAFAGTGIKTITIPSGVTRIWGAAFSQCPDLSEVTVLNPETGFNTNTLNDGQTDIFEKSPNVTIYAPGGSYAKSYAEANSIPFVPI